MQKNGLWNLVVNRMLNRSHASAGTYHLDYSTCSCILCGILHTQIVCTIIDKNVGRGIGNGSYRRVSLSCSFFFVSLINLVCNIIV